MLTIKQLRSESSLIFITFISCRTLKAENWWFLHVLLKLKKNWTSDLSISIVEIKFLISNFTSSFSLSVIAKTNTFCKTSFFCFLSCRLLVNLTQILSYLKIFALQSTNKIELCQFWSPLTMFHLPYNKKYFEKSIIFLDFSRKVLRKISYYPFMYIFWKIKVSQFLQ